MLPAAKRLFYRAAGVSGLNALLLRSAWRGRRLLVLCYHGVSLDDEHRWAPLYIAPEFFRRRLQAIRDADCTVLPLAAAVSMLYQGSLPPRAVVITFDDGFYDFYAQAWPLLREFGFPATVYLTTYYSTYNVPIFDLMASYLLWKARGRSFEVPEFGIGPATIDETSIQRHAGRIKAAALEKRLTGREKNAVLQTLAGRLQIDWDNLCSRRILHLMNPAEVAQLSVQGVDFQLHCHRHRVYRAESRFCAEITENRTAIERCGCPPPAHFCYPGGYRLPEFTGWLAGLGVASATTCDRGLATAASDPYALPRCEDTASMSAAEFSAWLSGVASWLPTRTHPPSASQLGDAEPAPQAARAGA